MRWRRQRWIKVVSGLAAVVAFCTTYALILPAITLESSPVCGLQEHIHTEACYEDVMEEDGAENHILTCKLPPHVHTDACYETDADGPSDSASDSTEASENADVSESTDPSDDIEPNDAADSTDEKREPEDTEDAEDTENTEDSDDEKPAEDTDLPDGEGDAAGTADEEPISAVFGAVLQLSSIVMLSDETAGDIAPSVADSYDRENAANEWQIVSGRYEGYDSRYKTVSADEDGGVRVQKNVIPAGTENEFYIYLSIDRKIEWDNILSSATLGLTTQGKWKEKDEGSVVDESDIGGNKSDYLVPESVATEEQKQSRWYTGTINIKKDGEILHTYRGTFYGTTPNASNCTGYLTNISGLDGKAIIASTHVNLHNDGGGTGSELAIDYSIDLDKVNMSYLTSEVILDTVADSMGDYIEFVETISSDGSSVYDEAARTLTWNPEPRNVAQTNTNENGKVTGYYENCAQLLYKVKLKTEAEGFHSCAAAMEAAEGETVYKTNGTTALRWHLKDSETEAYEQEFTSPEVRGLLYDVRFRKTDENGNPLAGAKFRISDGNDAEIRTVTTSEDEYTEFSGLPCGAYKITETEAPPGYKVQGDNLWTLTLYYTTDKEDFRQNGEKMLYQPTEGEDLVITNRKSEQKITLKKVDQWGTVPLSGAIFNLYGSEEDGSKGSDLLYGPLTSDENGVFSPEGLTLQEGIYYLEEIQAPDGYHKLTEPIKLTVDDNDVTLYIGSAAKVFPPEEDTGICIVEISNSSGEKLPETGGVGSVWYTIGGLLLMLGSGGLLYKRKKA